MARSRLIVAPFDAERRIVKEALLPNKMVQGRDKETEKSVASDGRYLPGCLDCLGNEERPGFRLHWMMRCDPVFAFPKPKSDLRAGYDGDMMYEN